MVVNRSTFPIELQGNKSIKLIKVSTELFCWVVGRGKCFISGSVNFSQEMGT